MTSLLPRSAAIVLLGMATLALAPSAEGGSRRCCKAKAEPAPAADGCRKPKKEPSFQEQFEEKICSPINCGKKKKK